MTARAIPKTPERLLARLEWRVVRRLDGRLMGGYRTAHRGAGTDLAGLRDYIEGDDARHIDWNVTARLNEPQLRVFTEDRELTAWLVLDRSASMAVGMRGRGKDDVLGELALVLARLFGRGGNRVGALLYDTGSIRTIPPGTGRRHALRIGAELARTAASRPRPGQNHQGTTDLAAMLDAVAKLARRRALIVVVSDFIGDGDWGRSLLRLVPRHEVVALRITDTADDELPDVGLVVIEDAETGEQLVVDSSDPLLRARLRAGVAERDTRLAAGMSRAGVPLHRIGTDADLATALIEVVASTQRRRA
ncbi:MAG TPA: DUF58 domain-containing protein [Streptosporangiaceae bacterium]|nr:DUF58 domain-containing protein [Streptosporangiaceae bacterium]